MTKRTEFIHRLQAALSQDTVSGPLYLFSVDFVNFKMINFCYGFDGGDQLLSAALQFITQIPSCLYCERAASDHLIFLLEAQESQSDQDIISMYSLSASHFVSTYQPLYPACKLKIWCGIAAVQNGDIASAVDNAYLARMEAKKKNYFPAVIFQDFMVQDLITQQKQENDVMLALSEKRFSFYLQPQVDMQTGQIVSAEALARGIDKDGQIICPSRFIPPLEQNGSIIELDYLILEQVCQHVQARLAQHEPVVPIAVNLSRRHLHHTDTVERIHSLVEKYHVPPEYITFELTENLYLDDFNNARELGLALNNYGHHTSIDDFGSGYAGIEIFRNLDFDELKLDRSLLSEYDTIPPRDIAVISGLIKIAQSLHVRVICEGVEYAVQCQQLLEVGGRVAQGYYFSKPVPPAQFYSTYHELNGYYPTCSA